MTASRTSSSRLFKIIRRMIGLAVLIIVSLYQLLVRLLRGAGRREFRHLLQGIPALLMFGGVVYASLVVSLHRSEYLMQYKHMATEASDAQQDEAALLFYRKLMTLDGGSAESRYGYALTLDESGNRLIQKGEQLESEDEAEAQRLIQLGQSRKLDALSTIEQIAPSDDQGFPKAHLYLARFMLANPEKYLVEKDGALKPGGVKTVKHHLDAAEKSDVLANSIELQMSFIIYHMGLKEVDEAVEHLEKIVNKKPFLHYDLMGFYLRMGRDKEALVHAQIATEYYKGLVEKEPDNHIARARCANLMLIRGNYSEAIMLLEKGMNRAQPENNPFPELLARTCVAMYDQLIQKGDVPIEQQLAHLRQALMYVTDYHPALARMAQLVSQPGEAGKEVETLLNRMIAEGRMPATGHFALGTKAWKEDQRDEALWHLERAYELDPSLGHIGNNLAWMLADCDPPELDRALQIIDSVLNKFPQVKTFHDTKGYILVKKGDWNAAITELEIALTEMRDNIDTHKSLAIAYRNLNKPELAEEHERIVKELEKAARIAKETQKVKQFDPDLLNNPENALTPSEDKK